MKKHNEGYAMVLVLVVITVLSLVAMAMMAASLRNLQNQQDSIERMGAKYAAQGEIEKEIAKLNSLIHEDGITTSVAVSELEGMFGDALKLQTSQNEDAYLKFDQYYLLTLTADASNLLALKKDANNVVVECVIRIEGSLVEEGGERKFLNFRWQYVSYTITEGGGAE